MRLDLSSLPAALRDLTTRSLEWMDVLWDEDCHLLHFARDGAPVSEPEGRAAAHDVRGTSWYALGLLMRNAPGDAERARHALTAVLATQFDEPGTPYHGTFLRRPEEPHPPAECARWRDYDPNWRQFIGTTLAIIIDEYAAELPAGLVERMDAAIQLAVEGEIGEDRLSPRYTNIALMRAPLDFWAGARYGRPDWRERGEEWGVEIHRAFMVNGAFEEYNSPTYYGPDLYALGFWQKYAHSERLAALGAELERALWLDMARYYHAGLRNLCGPYVRSYGMDMRTYVAVVGQAIWAAVGPELAPHPDPTGPMDHANDMTYPPNFAAVGVRVPREALEAFRAFPGEHLVERRIVRDPEMVASAWLGDRAMIGAMRTSRRRQAGGQFHPATLHWLLPDGNVGWARLVAGEAVNAVATRRALSISLAGDAVFEVHAPGASAAAFTSARWTLPGITVDLGHDAGALDVSATADRFLVRYSGASRLALGV